MGSISSENPLSSSLERKCSLPIEETQFPLLGAASSSLGPIRRKE
jgi:hypothetical protein